MSVCVTVSMESDGIRESSCRCLGGEEEEGALCAGFFTPRSMGAPHCPSVFPPVGDLLAHSLPDDPQQYLGTGGSGQRTKQSQVSFFPQRGHFTQQECKTFASWVYHLFYLLLFSAWRLAIHQSTFPTTPYDVVVPLLCPRLGHFKNLNVHPD